MQFDGNLMTTTMRKLTAAAQRALKFTGHQRDPELALTVQRGGKLPVSLQQTMFKKIDVNVNINVLLTKCIQFARPDSQRDLWVVAEQMVYSIVRLWVGHFMYCPCDDFRHQELCQAAQAAFDGEFGTRFTSSEMEALAEVVAAFFERNVVAHILTKDEGEYFAKGILYEHFVNSHQHSLLTNLFFLSQSWAAPGAWRDELGQFSMPEDPIAEALLPEVLEIVFGLHIVQTATGVRIIKGRPPHYSDWPYRVNQLAELLIPYISENSQDSPQPPGQNGDGSGIGEQPQDVSSTLTQILQQMNNPFLTTDDNTSRPQRISQSGGTGAGTESPPPPRYNLEELDRYYSQRATDVTVKTQDSAKEKPKQPENLQVGFLDSEPAPLSALVSGQIDWFRTRAIQTDKGNQLRLFKRIDPLEIPLGGDEPAETGPPHLLLLVDSSGSMGFNSAASSGKRGKYDVVLMACYGIFKYIVEQGLADSVQVACINFSGRSLESSWHPLSEVDNAEHIHEVKRVLLTYQGGGTVLSPEAIQRAFQTRPGRFLAIAITDGNLSNTSVAVSELRKLVQSGCQLVLLHIGGATQFTKAIEEMNCSVNILNSAKDLVGLSLRIAKERFKSSKM